MKLKLGAAVAAMVLLGACSNPVSEGVHEETAGLSLRAGDDEVVTVTGSGATGLVNLLPGSQSAQLTARFVDEDGDVITRSGYYLEVVSSNSAVATWVPTSPGAFTGRIAAHAAGSAGLQFQYMHGRVGSGHPDARYNVNVVVTAVP